MEKEWNISLNQYQRDNLLALLTDYIGYGKIYGVEPFTLADTGDWVGEIAQKLGYYTEEVGRPNVSAYDMDERVRWWLGNVINELEVLINET